MTKIELTKQAATLVVGAGTTRIVTQVIKNNTNPQTVTDKVTMVAGAVVIGRMAADATEKYTSAKIDSAAAKWKQFKARKTNRPV
jgi:hypothetical protein